MQTGVVILNSEASILYVNHAAQELFLASRPNTYSYFPMSDLLALNQLFSPALDLFRVVHDCISSRQPSTHTPIKLGLIFVSCTASPLVEGNTVTGCILEFLDVSETIKKEAAKDEFFSIASHELRTPLMTVAGSLTILAEHFQTNPIDPEYSPLIAEMQSSTEHLVSLVNDFLNMSRLEQGRFNYTFTTFPALDILQELTLETNALAQKNGLTVTIEGNQATLIYADRVRTKEILFNLLGNALKFTRQGGIILRPHLEGNQMKISVEDTGPGIPENERGHIFEKFKQASVTSYTLDSNHSSGLGLYVAKLMAEGMGGTVRLEKSVLGKGSVFSLHLPTTPQSELTQPTPRQIVSA